ncbi:hypothetical protein EYC59_03130 [Candidatus Saccharibacteria bacterium]|nr:MAG: hypothetical protein EYC59_03130 [Candidatus Saccharibacteria bacterium]
MNHNLPPAASVDMNQLAPNQQAAWGPAAEFPSNYGAVEPPKSIYEIDAALLPPDQQRLTSPYAQANNYVPPTPRRSFAEIQVADEIAGVAPPTAHANAAPEWSAPVAHESFGPSQEQTDARVARLTHGHDTRSVGRVFIGAIGGSVRAGLGEVFRKPDRQLVKDILNGGISGGVNGRIYTGAEKAAQVYEQLIRSNEKTRRIYDGDALNEQIRNMRDAEDYDLAA